MDKKKILKPLVGTLLTVSIIVGGLILIKGRNYVFAKYYYWNGYSKQKSEDRQGAIEEYSTVLEYDKKFVIAYISRGSAYLDLKEYDKAITDYNKAIELTPNDAQIYAYRGRAYFETKRYKQAIADYDQALELDEKFGYAYYQRGLLYGSVHYDFVKGCEDLNKALNLGYKDAAELLTSGICE